jgi:hypothetical protein
VVKPIKYRFKNKLGNIFENDSNKFDVKDKTSESPLFECM